MAWKKLRNAPGVLQVPAMCCNGKALAMPASKGTATGEDEPAQRACSTRLVTIHHSGLALLLSRRCSRIATCCCFTRSPSLHRQPVEIRPTNVTLSVGTPRINAQADFPRN